MSKRGVALIMALSVIVVLSILSGAFFLKSASQNTQAKKYVSSVRAFWLAESGIAEAIDNMPNSVSGDLGGSSYDYSATTTLISGNYYRINSIGTVTLPSGEVITRSLSAVAETDPINLGNFQHAIRTTVELDIKGGVTINGPTEEYASINFADLFENGKEDVEAYATAVYNDPPSNVTPVEGLTWVNVSAGNELRISTSTWTGSGILIVEGDAQITGGAFNGIIYVIGNLRMAGNAIINGTILAETSATIGDTEITGTVDITYDEDAIREAIEDISFIHPELVSWQDEGA